MAQAAFVYPLPHSATLRVALHPLRVDAFSAQRIENAIAGGIGAEAADPGDAEPEAGEADARVALGAGVIDLQDGRGSDCVTRRRRQP